MARRRPVAATSRLVAVRALRVVPWVLVTLRSVRIRSHRKAAVAATVQRLLAQRRRQGRVVTRARPQSDSALGPCRAVPRLVRTRRQHRVVRRSVEARRLYRLGRSAQAYRLRRLLWTRSPLAEALRRVSQARSQSVLTPWRPVRQRRRPAVLPPSAVPRSVVRRLATSRAPIRRAVSSASGSPARNAASRTLRQPSSPQPAPMLLTAVNFIR
ncbi:Uncharacterised protein [Burkholderia cenocepacia]|nr:Uncharacterised protein [Burkholderia cenocepacia]